MKEFREKAEYWQVTDQLAETLVEENECHETKRICLVSGNKLFFNQYTVNRPCWREEISYQCYSQPLDGCNHLKSQGCMLEVSNCVKKSGNICLLWQKNYSCIESQKKLSSSIAGSQMFCLGGDCHNPTIQAIQIWKILLI
ncbi:MAG: conjugal transfer protein TraN [Candidatus Rickettsia vulgarisii]